MKEFGHGKTSALRDLEDVAEVTMDDAVWEAVGKLSCADILSLTRWVRSVVRTHEGK